jgi:hypothetical protein
LPTINAQEPGWKNIEVVDKQGNPPEHWNQRFYDKKTGRLVQKGITQIARLWRTPSVAMVNQARATDPEYGVRLLEAGHTLTLAAQVINQKLWPTPRAGDLQDKVGSKALIVGNRLVRESGNNFSLSLASLVKINLWPTPTAMTNTGGQAMCKWGGSGSRKKLKTIVSPEELNGSLNPAWVSVMMGYPEDWLDIGTETGNAESPVLPLESPNAPPS